MSDLQCAATVVVLGPQASSPATLAQLRERRVALVYAGPGTAAPAAALADALGVAVRTDGAAEPDGTAGRPVAAVLEELADEHRGECVVLVVAAGTLAGLVRQAGGGAAPGVVIELDDDGRRVNPLPTGR
ncbi:hypothetical protein [Georgenia sp. MJ170]|uniref:hypothetical protein n=1 Tax=Georgenia sunbinii TaxID=3117728 RepID=UPI002F262A1B